MHGSYILVFICSVITVVNSGFLYGLLMCYTCILFNSCVNRVLTDGDVIVAVYSILIITCTIGTHKCSSRISSNFSRAAVQVLCNCS